MIMQGSLSSIVMLWWSPKDSKPQSPPDLVDNGSLADILYWSVFEKLKLGREKIVPVHFSLMGFTCEQVQPLCSIELLVTAGTILRQVTIMAKFLLVDRPLMYNAILGRTAFSELRAITSTLYLKMKFPTENGVKEARGN